MGTFDKNLKVTSKKILFIPLFDTFFFPTLFWRSKGKEKQILGGEKHERSARKEEGERVPLLASPSQAVSRINFLPFPFELLPRRKKKWKSENLYENKFSYKFSFQKGFWFCDRVRLNFKAFAWQNKELLHTSAWIGMTDRNNNTKSRYCY